MKAALNIMYKLVDINIQRIVSDISPGLNRQGKPQLRLVYMSFLVQAVPLTRTLTLNDLLLECGTNEGTELNENEKQISRGTELSQGFNTSDTFKPFKRHIRCPP